MPEQALTPVSAPRRVKDPSYRVFRAVTYAQGDAPERTAWEEMTKEDAPVKAASRKDAVAQVTEMNGTYMVLNASQVWLGTRGVETVKQESWT